MIALKRILVPHDFGETSTAALNFGSALARIFGATLDVLHVKERADSQIPTAQTGFVSNLDVRVGTPYEEITRYARERRSDLILMGTHGRGGLAHAVMGSVAEKVVRNAPCPVLTVRSVQHQLVGPSILVATDFGVAADTALMYGRTLAHAFGSRLHLLHVMDNYFMQPIAVDPHALEARAREQLRERLTDSDRSTLGATAVLEVSDEPARAIVDYANAARIDLIVMGTHGRKSAERLLMGSVAERVVRTAPCPVMTVRHPEREFVVPDNSTVAANARLPVVSETRNR